MGPKRKGVSKPNPSKGKAVTDKNAKHAQTVKPVKASSPKKSTRQGRKITVEDVTKAVKAISQPCRKRAITLEESPDEVSENSMDDSRDDPHYTQPPDKEIEIQETQDDQIEEEETPETQGDRNDSEKGGDYVEDDFDGLEDTQLQKEGKFVNNIGIIFLDFLRGNTQEKIKYVPVVYYDFPELELCTLFFAFVYE